MGAGGSRQDLKPAAVEGDEVVVDQAVADEDIVVQGELERVADPVVGVEADAIAVTGQDQEEVARGEPDRGYSPATMIRRSEPLTSAPCDEARAATRRPYIVSLLRDLFAGCAQ
jgi:hypothetical protein